MYVCVYIYIYLHYYSYVMYFMLTKGKFIYQMYSNQ